MCGDLFVRIEQSRRTYSPYPLKICHLFGFPSWKSKVQWSKNYRDQNLPFRKFQPEKKAPVSSRWPFYGKNPLKMGNYITF